MQSFQLCQLYVVMRSLSHDAGVVFVHAFVTGGIDYCCSVLAGFPLGLLDRVFQSAARFVGHITICALASGYMRDVLHWLPVSKCISYRIAVLVWRSLTGCAPSYLSDLCRPVVSDLASCRALHSSARGELLVPRAHSALKQHRSFSVISSTTWNELPLTLRLLPRNTVSSFFKLLTSFLFGHS